MRLAILLSLALGFAAAPALAADVVNGEKVFTKCMQCHRIGIGATNFYGPVLNGLIGRKSGTVPGYDYSVAMKQFKLVWNKTTLSDYLKHPQHTMPGAEMTFKGLDNQKDIDDVIAYIAQYRRDGGKD